MTERVYEMRLGCSYSGPDNAVSELQIEYDAEGEWKTFDIADGASDFQLFTYSILNCQHNSLCRNCSDLGLVLESAKGAIRVVTDESWRMQWVQVSFDGVLENGDPSKEDIIYITGKMGECPVAVNLRYPETGDVITELQLS